MKKIVIDLDGDLGEAIHEIEKLIKEVETFPNKVATEGSLHATKRYDGYTAITANGNTVGYGKAPILVTPELHENASKSVFINASGEEVGFAEWGTGIYADNDPKVDIPTGFATWSDANGGELSQKGYWWYKKDRYYGSRPTLAMTQTVEYLRHNTVNMAKEYFN